MEIKEQNYYPLLNPHGAYEMLRQKDIASIMKESITYQFFNRYSLIWVYAEDKMSTEYEVKDYLTSISKSI